MALIEKPDNRTYSLTQRLGMDDQKEFIISETARNEREIKPILNFGAYLNKVDDLDPNRPLAVMANVGVEIDDKPDHYFAGLSLDWSKGVSLGLGVSQFRQTELLDDFQPGQIIPQALGDNGQPTGDALISEVFTREKNELGLYLNIALRPAIFKALKGLRKGN